MSDEDEYYLTSNGEPLEFLVAYDPTADKQVIKEQTVGIVVFPTRWVVKGTINPDEMRVYADGTAGAEVGTEGEEDRRDAAEPIFKEILNSNVEGRTSQEIEKAWNWHHGRVSGPLSNLHKKGLIVRLTEKRGGYVRADGTVHRGYSVYVAKAYIDGRDYYEHGSVRKARKRAERWDAAVQRLQEEGEGEDE
jgi:hypothetical protein